MCYNKGCPILNRENRINHIRNTEGLGFGT